jgi:hypothetical protein
MRYAIGVNDQGVIPYLDIGMPGFTDIRQTWARQDSNLRHEG